jgi:hypothetical protein
MEDQEIPQQIKGDWILVSIEVEGTTQVPKLTPWDGIAPCYEDYDLTILWQAVAHAQYTATREMPPQQQPY